MYAYQVTTKGPRPTGWELKAEDVWRGAHHGVEAEVADVTGDDGLLFGRSHAEGVVDHCLLHRVHLSNTHTRAHTHTHTHTHTKITNIQYMHTNILTHVYIYTNDYIYHIYIYMLIDYRFITRRARYRVQIWVFRVQI